MSSTLSTTNQTKWKDCCASSAKLGLTLRSNGEEPVMVYTPDRQLVQAGFDAPTVAPTVADGGAGVLTAGYVAYCYCYASSKYASVEAIVEAGGELWPKSSPSPPSATYSVTVSHRNTVTVTKSARSDVDKILIYRTAIKSSAAEATELAEAGEMFYAGVVDDNAVPGTTTFSDNVVAGQEQMELDNYTAPQFWLCVYDGDRWWGFGNPALDVAVTLNGASSIVAVANTFYAGRNGQLVTFDGITTGGFDGKGTYYFKYLSDSVANISASPDLSTAAVTPASGTTTMRVRGFSGVLYRSKVNNPFAWGFTELQYAPDNSSVVRVPQQYALNIGGRGAAIAVMTEQRLLKLDVENPAAAYTLNLQLAGGEGFEGSKRVISRQFTVSSHFAQFAASFPDGSTGLAGIDAGNWSLTRAAAGTQQGFGDEVFSTLRAMVTTDDNPRLFHGVFDPSTELSVWWIKTATDPDNLISIDTCICYHGPSGQFSLFRDFDVTASASVYDPVTLETIIMVGTAGGQIAQAFVEGVNANLTLNTLAARSFTAVDPAFERVAVNFTGAATDPSPLAGDYFDLYDINGAVRVWLQSDTAPASPPSAPAGGRLVKIDGGADTDIQSCVANIVATLNGDSAFTILNSSTIGFDYDLTTYGATTNPDEGTVGSGAIGFIIETTGTGGIEFDNPVTLDPYAWAFFSNGGNGEYWFRANARGEFNGSLVLVAETGEILTANPYGAGDTGTAYPGLINCEAQTYFQPSQSRASIPRELWSTFRNADADNIFFRFYEDFDTEPLGSPIVPAQTDRRTGVPSMNWNTTGLPSVQVNQMGYRLVERGYEAFEVLGLDVKQHRT